MQPQENEAANAVASVLQTKVCRGVLSTECDCPCHSPCISLPVQAAQNLLKQQAAERRRPSVTAEDVSSGSRPRHHSPQPCLSKTAVAAVGGSRRPAQPSSSAGQAGERQAAGGNQAAAGAVRSSCPPAAMAAALAGEAPSAPPVAAQAAAGSGDQQGDKLSTPIVSLLAESARLITSLDCGEAGFAGFGSALGSEAAGSSSAATSGTQGTASTPDGAVRPAEAPEADADYSTPRGAVSLRWQGQQGQARHAAGAGNRAEGQLPAAVPAAVGAGASERLSMNLVSQHARPAWMIFQKCIAHLSARSVVLDTRIAVSCSGPLALPAAEAAQPAAAVPHLHPSELPGPPEQPQQRRLQQQQRLHSPLQHAPGRGPGHDGAAQQLASGPGSSPRPGSCGGGCRVCRRGSSKGEGHHGCSTWLSVLT